MIDEFAPIQRTTHEADGSIRTELIYTPDMIDKMAASLVKEVDEELLKRIAPKYGYVKERTCRPMPATSGTVCIVVRMGFSNEFGYWKCSECGCECFEGARYCMNCGAKAVPE